MFKSHKEKIAYKQGIKKGRSGGRVWKGRDDPPCIKSTHNFKSNKSDKYWNDFFDLSIKKSNESQKSKSK